MNHQYQLTFDNQFNGILVQAIEEIRIGQLISVALVLEELWIDRQNKFIMVILQLH
jgi:hypothetical protein